MGWSERVTRVDTQFHADHVSPQNIPDHISHESTALSFLELFLHADFWGLLCRQTKLRAEQVKQSKPASYYAKNFKPIAVPELKAFLGLRLQMEKCVIMLPLFRRYYSPRQQLSLDEGMIPTKNRLAIKQYVRDKPVRWGIKSFLLCEAKTGYNLDAEIYTGQVRDRHWPLLGSAGSVVRRLVENSKVTNKNHMLFMDRFYNSINSIVLFHLLKNELGVLATGTVMPSCKHYPQVTLQEADRTWPVRIPVPGSSVRHHLEGTQAHPLPEQLPRPEESVHCEQACGGLARVVDRATAIGGLHQVI